MQGGTVMAVLWRLKPAFAWRVAGVPILAGTEWP